MNKEQLEYKAIWVRPALHQRIKVAALLKEKSMNDYLFDLLENDHIQSKKNNKTKVR
jgi:predicted HicB family RNase H-like nuclease